MIEALIAVVAVAVFEMGMVIVALVWDMTKIYDRVQELEDRAVREIPNEWGR